MRVGVVAIQGDYEKHADALKRSGVEGLEIQEVRTPEELAHVERVILPGGESTTVGLLLDRYGLGDALKQAASEGMPIWGTCMGMIVLAREVASKPEQYTLGLLDVRVRRNAFGAQVHSFEDEVEMTNLDQPVLGVFIRAPVVDQIGTDVEELARYQGQLVAVRQRNVIGTSFHPELTDDVRLHRWFLTL
jgi:5'-phosphate synthase pdxT subunit